MAHIHYYFTDLEFLAESSKPTCCLKQGTYDFLHLKWTDTHKALFEILSSTTPLPGLTDPIHPDVSVLPIFNCWQMAQLTN